MQDKQSEIDMFDVEYEHGYDLTEKQQLEKIYSELLNFTPTEFFVKPLLLIK